MGIRQWLAKMIAGKDPVDEQTKEKAQAALSQFELTQEDIKKEKARIKSKDSTARRIRQEKITEIDEKCKQAHESLRKAKKEEPAPKNELPFRRFGVA